jgi:Ni2+-binding GTPase involved in maturation of urease and hydrogenase
MQISAAHGPVKTWLVSGFLGAGKTTFILEQVKRSGARVAVLVNEFGELGMDGALIRSVGGIDVVEMPGGCICCTQKEGLAESVQRIASQLRPELLLIEPSGIAESSEILKVLTAMTLDGLIRLEAAIAVIDAETFLEFSAPDAFGPFFLDQVVNADLILVNKSDLVTPTELAEIEQRLDALRPGSLLLKTEFCRMEEELPAGRCIAPISSGGVASVPAMECVSVTPGMTFSNQDLEQFLAELARGGFGRVVRGKGFLQVMDKGWQNLQIVGGRVALEPFPAVAEPRLTLIGYGLNGGRLREYVRCELEAGH